VPAFHGQHQYTSDCSSSQKDIQAQFLET
jgi:hypothetical protein